MSTAQKSLRVLASIYARAGAQFNRGFSRHEERDDSRRRDALWRVRQFCCEGAEIKTKIGTSMEARL